MSRIGSCSIDGCDDVILARGVCERHYARIRRTGCSEVRTPFRRGQCKEWIDTLLTSDLTDECVVWPYRKNVAGYGMIGAEYVTRVVLAATDGPRPAEMFALHHCDNPPCCNPRHLRWGTRSDNAGDMLARGRGRWQGNLSQ